MDIVYKIGHALYLNITNRCTNRCGFCVRFKTDSLQGYELKLSQEPTAAEVLTAIGDASAYREIVFCGYGEPLLRLEEVVAISKALKERGANVRINTNGHANIIHRRNIVPDIAPYVTTVSVSLNAATAEQYQGLCHPDFGAGAYQAVKDFILESKKLIPRVVVTAVSLPGVDVQEIKKIVTEELGVTFKLRHYDDIITTEAYGKNP
jgi:TatD DNase family protein